MSKHRSFPTGKSRTALRQAQGERRKYWLSLLPLALAAPAAAQLDPPEWTRPTAPFHIVGNIWYVGTQGLAAYAIKTPKGAILLDATMAENVPAIERNLATIGVPVKSVKYLLVSHAHFDHAAGDAQFQRDSGAKLVVGRGDAAAIRTGIPPGETSYGVIKFPAARVDRAIRDGEKVTLGGVTLAAVATPGHTPGCTTWTMRTTEEGKTLDVVFPCSVSVAGNKLMGNTRYPGIVADYRKSFARLAALKADVVLPAHPELADVLVRHARNDWIAPQLLGKMTAEMRAAFDAELTRQQQRT